VNQIVKKINQKNYEHKWSFGNHIFFVITIKILVSTVITSSSGAKSKVAMVESILFSENHLSNIFSKFTSTFFVIFITKLAPIPVKSSLALEVLSLIAK